MRMPAIRGIIDRRILANYRVDPNYLAGVLPAPFRPKLVEGWGIGGICLIRLKRVRPASLPISWGLSSENAAHRIAVEWDSKSGPREGVYIPRRDTDSYLNSLVGGRVFPGIHHHARFQIEEDDDQFRVTMNSDDGKARVHVSGHVSSQLPGTSLFDSIQSASDFFQTGSLGYSDTRKAGVFDGLELKCDQWQVDALEVEKIESSFFEDRSQFPQGSVQFDGALLMRGISHLWLGRPDLCCAEEVTHAEND